MSYDKDVDRVDAEIASRLKGLEEVIEEQAELYRDKIADLEEALEEKDTEIAKVESECEDKIAGFEDTIADLEDKIKVLEHQLENVDMKELAHKLEKEY